MGGLSKADMSDNDEVGSAHKARRGWSRRHESVVRKNKGKLDRVVRAKGDRAELEREHTTWRLKGLTERQWGGLKVGLKVSAGRRETRS